MFLALNFVISCLCNLVYPAYSRFTFIDILKPCQGYLFREKFPGPGLQYLLSFQPGLTRELALFILMRVLSLIMKTHLTQSISDLRLQIDESPAGINWRFSGFCYPVNISRTFSIPALGPFLRLLVLFLGFPASPGWLSILDSLPLDLQKDIVIIYNIYGTWTWCSGLGREFGSH